VTAPMAGLLPWRLVPGVLAFLWGISIVAAWRAGRLTRWGLAGVPYVALPILALGLLRQGNWGLVAVLWLMATVWAADIGAFFAGRIIGGPKLAPRISPKKTWAGLAGAVAGAMLSSLAVWLAAGLGNTGLALSLGALTGVIEQVGDLFESAAKRRFGLKDSGDLIPGHGGILDRVDGLVAAAVVAGLVGAAHAGSGAVAEGLLKW
jgi:phosphatidate cytidylyltransferase